MTDDNNNNIFARGVYEIVIGDSATVENRKCYHIVNVETGVIEAEDFMLPRAIGLCKSLAEYDPYMDDIESGKSGLAIVDATGRPKQH